MRPSLRWLGRLRPLAEPLRRTPMRPRTPARVAPAQGGEVARAAAEVPGVSSRALGGEGQEGAPVL